MSTGRALNLAFTALSGIVVDMSVRMHISHSKTGSRRAHHRAIQATVVPTPSGARRRHFADAETGTYRGKQIFSPKGASVAKAVVATKSVKAAKKAPTTKTVAKKAEKKTAK